MQDLRLEVLQTFNKIQEVPLLISLLPNMIHLHWMSDVLLEVSSGKTLACFNMYNVKDTSNFFPLGLSIQQQVMHMHT